VDSTLADISKPIMQSKNEKLNGDTPIKMKQV